MITLPVSALRRDAGDWHSSYIESNARIQPGLLLATSKAAEYAPYFVGYFVGVGYVPESEDSCSVVW